MQPELLQDLLELCREGGYEPLALANIGPNTDLVMPVLEQSILLRESGAAELSLALLDRAEAGGLRSGWIQDNRARALLLLQRRDEAKKLWLDLQKQSNESLQNIAWEQLEQLEVEEKIPTLWPQLRRLAEENGWNFKYLSVGHASYPAFERAVLEEVVITREKGCARLSLSLIELALKAGFRSPWLQDNKARCLLKNGDVLQACRIWRELEANSSMDDMRSAAAAMLNTCHREEQRLLIDQHEKMWLDKAQQLYQNGDLSSALLELIEALIDFPDSKSIEEYLIKLMEHRRIREDSLWSNLSPWLQRSELNLEVHEALLRAFEQRFDI